MFQKNHPKILMYGISFIYPWYYVDNKKYFLYVFCFQLEF